MPVQTKICGLNSPAAVEAAARGGAAYAGFVFFPPSPRNLEPESAAALAALLPPGIHKTGVFVDPGDLEIDLVLSEVELDILQLHGNETPARIEEIRDKFNLEIMKAVAIAGEEDILHAAAYEDITDLLLFDAKPPKSMAGALPGGNGLAFDWKLLASRRWKCPWILSGGLTAETVGEAVRISGARIVDVSSGVESAPGRKNPSMIRDFLAAVNKL